ncbi:hypothetical protein EFO70_02650 [Lacticaseibacillus rhamnosus]|nr:hypothetical protein [Lacticaseibacillus rhamnosus]MCT3180448.1 hypothetical protein [Lacticaseibacillus rhamnosus]
MAIATEVLTRRLLRRGARYGEREPARLEPDKHLYITHFECFHHTMYHGLIDSAKPKNTRRIAAASFFLSWSIEKKIADAAFPTNDLSNCLVNVL